MPVRRQLSTAIDLLIRGGQVGAVQLALFSDITRDEARAVREALPKMPAPTRLALVTEAAEAAEADIDVDFTALALAALDDAEPGIRVRGIQALWESESPTVGARLKELLLAEADDNVRAGAAGGLRRFVLLGELGRLSSSQVTPILEALRAAVSDANESVDVRGRAVESLGPSTTAWAATLISDAYYDDDPRLRLAGVRAMGHSADERWLELLTDEAESDDPAFRFEAAVALGVIGAETCLPALFGLVEDDDREVALAAIAALAEVAGPEAIERLKELVDSGAEPFKAAAARALEIIAGDAEADDQEDDEHNGDQDDDDDDDDDDDEDDE